MKYLTNPLYDFHHLDPTLIPVCSSVKFLQPNYMGLNLVLPLEPVPVQNFNSGSVNLPSK